MKKKDDDIKKPLPSSITPDAARNLLTQEEIDKLQAEVIAEAEEQAREEARKSLKEQMRLEARRKKGLEEEQVTLTIDLAPYADRLLIDNVAYLQGVTYTVRSSLAAVLFEQMQRTWGHQSVIDGKNENFYRKTRGARVLPDGNVVNTSQILRA